MDKAVIEFTAQAISILATVVQICSYQSKSNRGLFAMQGVAGFLFSINFFLLGAYTAAVINIINILRSLLMAYGERHRRIIIPIVLCAIYTVAVAFTYEGWLSILLLLVQIGGTLSMWSADGAIIRIYQLFICSPAWLANNIIVFSIGGIITEAFSIASIIISIIRYGFAGLKRNAHGSGKDGEKRNLSKS